MQMTEINFQETKIFLVLRKTKHQISLSINKELMNSMVDGKS